MSPREVRRTTERGASPRCSGSDSDGNIRRALGWTWRILNRREPRKYRWRMSRASHAREPAHEAMAALKSCEPPAIEILKI